MAVRKVVEVEGLDNVLRNLNKEIKNIKGRTRKGMIEAVLAVRKEAQKICPHETGNLNASCFTNVYGGGKPSTTSFGKSPHFKSETKDGKKVDVGRLRTEHACTVEKHKGDMFDDPTAVIGFTAFYAPYVHEMVGAHFKKPGAQAKFLETPLKELSCEILDIIKRNARIR